ncbi:LLM class flavin-dependent oxidoreductase [Flavobacterium acetivorans]|uniref:LLM class flavin-dependent oxidoreductase n=1 Tax=Flavobacterium acetivorans TaxID=2893883 RepID=UPI001E560B98|nr:LLM class flavin-dependent oxidoreductase [Flavobacterium sp. F-29]UFH34673.1 LLM class flavin-dependent oxidoreductase [Flavobacterium sp. F-29]
MKNNVINTGSPDNKPASFQPLGKQGNAPVPLSILDVATTGKGYSAAEAVATSIALAKFADQRGFARYWVAEHHGMPAVSTSSPAMLLSRLIGETKNIRLGSDGMMLPNFPPLVVAEQFGMLQAMASGRIDLGIGRAPGTNGLTASALRGNHLGAEDFPDLLTELLHFLKDDFPDGHPFKNRVFAVPGPGQDRENGIARSFDSPSVWLLGSSGYSAQLAGKLGLPFAFAAQLAPENMLFAFDLYKKNFKKSKVLDKPHTIACFSVFAADTVEEAKIQTHAFAHSMLRMMKGQTYVIPSPEELKDYSYDHSEKFVLESWHEKMIYGTADQVVSRLNEYQKISGADELMIANLGHSPEGILHSAKLIADAYNMPTLGLEINLNE